MHIDQLFSQLDEQRHAQGDNTPATLTVSRDWAQGRTLFGGLSASLAYRAIENQLASPRMLRSFNTSFIGPIYPEQPFTIEAEILREGRNATQAVARIIQDGNTAVMCQAAFGVARPSKIAVQDRRKHNMMAPAKANFIPQIPKVTPKFLRHMDLAKCDGGWPFTGRKSHHVGGWMRFKKAPTKLTDAHLIALIDAWPPTILQMLKWPAPASTMSWNVEFIHPHRPMNPDNWFAYQASTRQAADGYGHTEADIYDSYGELVAISRQVVTVFD
ncbi:thioesterase family protein [Neiella sp. HB171785]|uniref:Thioesterase family protein n=1 Tax=Neiella litorisoli TaxID=2771431 RepID=A0A8J6QUJ8_9GAMM|nr:thioesterase family protein [Neiella litorisoli]MBD1391024.1 thioesterase family protein [Neiella litorisoli]